MDGGCYDQQAQHCGNLMRAGGCGTRGKEAALGPGSGWNRVTKAPVAHGGVLKILF